MTEQMIHPKVCAVCGQVCDRYRGQWIHTTEIVGTSDHVCIPVDYHAVELVTRCDFCHRKVELSKRWIVPARDFKVKVINTISIGGWACDEECARIAARRDWSAMADRHYESPESTTPDAPSYRQWLLGMYAQLEEHMGEPRPFRAGDEMVPAESGAAAE